MTRTRFIAVCTALCLTAAAGCGKDDSTGQKSAKSASGKAETAPAAKLTYKPIGDFGLEVQVSADTSIDDNTKSAGFPTATIWSSPTVFVTGKGELFWLADVEAAKRDAQGDPNPFKEFTKEDVTDGGFHLEYTLESMMDKKPLYGFRIRTTIGGKPYDCHTNSQSEQERAAAIAICQSLRPAS